MFWGRSDAVIDDKGRVVLPVKFREALVKKDETSLFLTNLDGCLFAYPGSIWMGIVDKFRQRPGRTDEEANFIRFFMGSAHECMFDRQGRLLVPPSLKRYAGLEKEVVIVGNIDRFEIWNAGRFYEQMHKTEEAAGKGDIRSIRNDIGL